jgi:hypothetical protein
VVDNAPYLPSVSIARGLPPAELLSEVLSLLANVASIPSPDPSPVTNNLGAPGWLTSPSALPPASSWSVRAVSGGLTNDLYLVNCSEMPLGEAGEGVLLRLFGGDGVIDRDRETSTFAALCRDGIG